MSVDELRRPRSPADYAYRQHGQQSAWTNVGTSIAQAAGAYVVTLVISVGIVLGLMEVINALAYGELTLHGVLVAACGLIIAGIYGAVGGLFFAGFLSIPTLTAVALALRLLDWRPPWERVGLFSGGLVAYLAMLPLSLLMLQAPRVHAGTILVWLLGLAAAVFACQIGGALGGLRSRRKDRRHASSSPPRFTLWQLMGVMALVSVLLTLLRVAGLLTLPMLLITLAWLAVQTLGAGPAMRLAKRLHKRWLRQERGLRQYRFRQWRDRIRAQPPREENTPVARST